MNFWVISGCVPHDPMAFKKWVGRPYRYQIVQEIDGRRIQGFPSHWKGWSNTRPCNYSESVQARIYWLWGAHHEALKITHVMFLQLYSHTLGSCIAEELFSGFLHITLISQLTTLPCSKATLLPFSLFFFARPDHHILQPLVPGDRYILIARFISRLGKFSCQISLVSNISYIFHVHVDLPLSMLNINLCRVASQQISVTK